MPGKKRLYGIYRRVINFNSIEINYSAEEQSWDSVATPTSKY